LSPSHNMTYLGGLSHSPPREHITAISIRWKLKASYMGMRFWRGLSHSNFTENIGPFIG
jgi:hypothetical protein